MPIVDAGVPIVDAAMPSGDVVLTDGAGPGDTQTGSCVSDAYPAVPTPLQLYVMFDQSGSMGNPVGGDTRLGVIRAGFNDFLSSEASGGMSMGIGFFGDDPFGETSCAPEDYSTPTAPIAPLPGNATAIQQALDSIEPTGETPTGAAIRGACRYVESWNLQSLGRRAQVLLLTDGYPEAPVTAALGGCTPTLADAVAAAAECVAATPSILVHVLAVGPNLSSLSSIAAAGGTTEAVLIETTEVQSGVRQALEALRLSAPRCEYALPEPAAGTLDFGSVNVEILNEGVIYYTGSELACDPVTGGWHYDDRAQPEQIVLCPTTCAALADPASEVQIVLGCNTVLLPS